MLIGLQVRGPIATSMSRRKAAVVSDRRVVGDLVGSGTRVHTRQGSNKFGVSSLYQYHA